MSNLAEAFNEGYYQTGTVEPASFDDLPAGDYPVIITDSEMKDTKDFQGKYLQLTYDIIEGQHKGRKLFDRLNLINRNDTARAISKQSLESICRATGYVGQLRDSSQLHRKLMIIRLSYNTVDKSGNPIPEGRRNDIAAYKPAHAGQAAPAPQATYQDAPLHPQGTAAPVAPYNAGSYAEKSGGVAMASAPAANKAPWE